MTDTPDRPNGSTARPPRPSSTPGDRVAPPRSVGRRPRRARLRLAARAALLVGLIGLTAWNLTRSDGLPDALAAEGRGDHVLAVRRALDHLDRRPWSREAARAAARNLCRLGFVEASEPYFARGGSPGREDLLALAFAHFRANHRDESARLYTQVLERWPDEPTALRELAVLRQVEGNLPEALRLAKRLAVVPGHEVIGLTMVGAYQRYHLEPGEAVAAFDKVIELDPDLRRMPLPQNEFWHYYATDLLAVGRTETIRRELGRALHSSGNADVQGDARLWTALGHAYHLEGDFSSAEETFRWAVRLDPQLEEAWGSLGQVLLALDRPEDALGPLQHAQALDPESWTTVYNLILANTRLGRRDEVERLRVRAEEIRRKYGVPVSGMSSYSPRVKIPSP